MRIVATSDTHFPFSEDRIPNGDLLIHAGDLMYTGYLDEWHARVESLRALEHKNKIIVPGNHDYHIENYEGVARAELRRAGVKTVGTHPDFAITTVGGYRILGVPYVTGLNGWAFCRDERWLLNYMEALDIDNNPVDIVVTHAPPFNILDAIHPEQKEVRSQEHVGGMAFNYWFYSLKNKPKVWICGHIHESYGRTTIEGCTFYNVAMCDRMYSQENAPMIIDLE
jgi:Icc-related predicted phosphoesterase